MEPINVGQQPGEHPILQANVNKNIPTTRDIEYENALRYVRRVKSTFGKDSEVYKQFLDITQDIREDRFDTNVVIKRIAHLFRGHASFINGFNLFLPPGYTMPIETPTTQPFLSYTAAEDLRI